VWFVVKNLGVKSLVKFASKGQGARSGRIAGEGAMRNLNHGVQDYRIKTPCNSVVKIPVGYRKPQF